MAQSTWRFLHLDGKIVAERILGLGSTGLVIQQGSRAVKIPQLSQQIDDEIITNGGLSFQDDEYSANIESIDDEKDIYRRLGNHPDIVRCYNLSTSEHSIEMDMMENGDLRAYLASNTPKRHVQLSWFIRMARAMAFIHGRRVIITDVRLENFLLDNQLAVKFADFGESRLMPLDWDLNGTDKLGFSVMTDIGQLGAVIYRIVTGQDCNFIVWHEGTKVTWPERDRLPSTESVWLGHIVERCWTRGFTGADEIAKELENVARVFDHNCLI